jgi:hypothetical protein
MCGLICAVIILAGAFMIHPGLGFVVLGLWLFAVIEDNK